METDGAGEVHRYERVHGGFPINEAFAHADNRAASHPRRTRQVFECHHGEVRFDNIKCHVNWFSDDGEVPRVRKNADVLRVKPFDEVHHGARVEAHGGSGVVMNAGARPVFLRKFRESVQLAADKIDLAPIAVILRVPVPISKFDIFNTGFACGGIDTNRLRVGRFEKIAGCRNQRNRQPFSGELFCR